MRNSAAQALTGRAVGYHRWDVRWRYQYEEGPGSCGVSDVTIDLSSTITLPDWVGGPSADSSLVTAWEAYVTSLRYHEYCHRVLAYQQANEIYRELKRERSGSCALLRGRVESKGRAILEKYKKLNEEFDQDSRGYIRWPPRTDERIPPPCPMGW